MPLQVVSQTPNVSCDLCIVVGDCQPRLDGLVTSCTAVREEWLLQAVENYALPSDLQQYKLQTGSDSA